jgi:high affinity Mn2+ porin
LSQEADMHDLGTPIRPTRAGRLPFAALAGLALVGGSGVAMADDAPASAVAEDGRFAVHGQFSYVEQETDAFRAPYAGPNSLASDAGRETIDATLFAGARLWSGAEGWIDVDVDQGFGLDNTLGVAAFPSGAAYKVGRNEPYLRLTRAFVRETIGLDGDLDPVEGAANQFGGPVSANRFVFTVGKFGVPDVFDTNQYAHDPRADFLNWAAIDAATFDYAADAWGYTVGAAAEWYQGRWTLRGGLFDLSDVPNSVHLEPGGHEFQMVAELERRHELFGAPGRLLLTAFESRGRMGLLDQAVALAAATGTAVDVASVRAYRSRTGIDLDLEQELTRDVGLFARIGGAGGDVETYEFTDVDRTLAAGLSLKGTGWSRARDTVGLAAIVDRISGAREAFLDAGGLGILVGDGRLPHPGPEAVTEVYYNLNAFGATHVTLDYQWVDHPAYNRDRGPVSVFALRLHTEF